MLISIALVLVTSTSSPVTELFRDAHRGPPSKLKTARTDDGRLVAVIGEFDVGLDETTSTDPVIVANALSQFISAHAVAFGGDRNFELTLIHSETSQIDDQLRAMRFLQTHRGHAIDGGEITVTLFESGRIHSVNGPIAAASTYADLELSSPSPADVLAIIHVAGQALPASEIAAAALDTLREVDFVFGVDGRAHYVSAESDVEAERVLLLDEPATLWIVDTGAAIVRLREDGGIESAVSKRRTANGACDVRRQDYLKFTSGVIMGFNRDGKNGTIVNRISCDGDFAFSGCDWRLKRSEGGISHPIPRVDDADSFSEVQINGACTGFIPAFTSTDANDVEEQTGFFAMHRARAHMITNAFTAVTVDQTDPVEMHVDASAATGSDFSAFFDTILKEIHMGNSISTEVDVMFHEYGHYVQWAYGDTSFNCTSTDHGAATGETIANAFAYIMALSEFQLGYHSVLGMAGGQAPVAHTDSASRIVNPAGDCVLGVDGSNPREIHIFGRAFEQAVWELLFNKNCNSDTCTANTTFGSTIWTGGASASTVRLRVGTALAHAQKVLGTSQNFFQISLHMEDRIGNDVDAATESRAALVFSHHGY